MQIPSVSSIFQAKLGQAGLGQASAGFSSEYAAALQETSDPTSRNTGNFHEMNIVPSSETALSAQAKPLGWTQAQLLSSIAGAGNAYSGALRFISVGGAAAATDPSATAAGLVEWAKQFVGTPYVRGGEDLLKGADCSGFTQSVFKQFGVNLPRSAYRQSLVGTPVDPDNLQPGDLMFFKNDDYAPVTHVAIYIGDNKILHASSVKTGVIISNLKKNWQNGDFVCAKRML